MMKTDVEFISQARDHTFIDSWYELTTSSHFWFQWRMLAAAHQLASMKLPLNKPLRALEVGCGTGVLREQFEAETDWIVDGCDLDHNALSRATSGRGRILYYDVTDEFEQLKCAYDVIILFDVLEHIEKTRPFLESILKHLKPNGLFLVNVPALQSLYGKYDEAAGHVRRYKKDSLAKEFADTNLEIEDMRYWGFSLVPVLLLRKLINKLMRHQSSDEIIKSGFRPPLDVVNKTFRTLMRVEAFLLKAPPLGSSLLMIGRKGS